MFKRFRVLVLMILVLAFAAPTAWADTFYNSMGYNFHYDDWGVPAGTNILTFNPAGHVTGFSGDNSGGTEDAGGELGYLLMSGGNANTMGFTAQINFSNFSAENGHFGLEMGWNTKGEAFGSESDNSYAGAGIYRANHDTLGSGYATTYSNEETGAEGPIGLLFPAGEPQGALKLEKIGQELKTYWGTGDGTFTLLNILTLNLDLGQFLTLSIIGGTEAGGELDVQFSGFSGDPGPPAATPIPGAVWLLGSGLVGLVGLRKKYRS